MEAARPAPQSLPGPRAPVPQRLRALGHAYHLVARERGGRRNGTRLPGASRGHRETLRPRAQPAPRSPPCLERIAHAARVGPTMPAPIEFVSGSGRQPGRPRAGAPPEAYAMPAQLMPSYALDRGASTRPVPAGAPRRALAAGLRPPLLAPGGAVGPVRPRAQRQRKDKAQTLAEGGQRSRAPGAGRTGALARRNHPRRGLAPPRTRACLTAMQTFGLTRADGTAAEARGGGPQPRSLWAALWAAVDRPPAPRRPPK